MSKQPCPCPYHRKLREEEAQGPRPGWLQREFDAVRKETAPLAAAWVKIEPGCEMPEVGQRVLLLFPDGEAWCGSLYRHTADRDAWQWHCDKDRSRGWTGFNSKGGPTHYAVLRMPEGK